MLQSRKTGNEILYMCDLKICVHESKDMINYNERVSQECQRQTLSCIAIDIARGTMLFENGTREDINATYLVKIEK